MKEVVGNRASVAPSCTARLPHRPLPPPITTLSSPHFPYLERRIIGLGACLRHQELDVGIGHPALGVSGSSSTAPGWSGSHTQEPVSMDRVLATRVIGGRLLDSLRQLRCPGGLVVIGSQPQDDLANDYGLPATVRPPAQG